MADARSQRNPGRASRAIATRLGDMSRRMLMMVLCLALLAQLVACHGPEPGRQANSVGSPLRGEDAARAQGAAIKAHLEDPPSIAGLARICVAVASAPAETDESRVNASADPPEALLASLGAAYPTLRAISECKARPEQREITLSIGWPVTVGQEIQVPLDRNCWWTCGGGYRVRLRRVGATFQVVGQESDRWAS